MKNKFLLTTLMSIMLVACSGEKSSTDQKTQNNDGISAATKNLNLFNWSDYVDPETVSEFEKENDIRVISNYYDSNEKLEAIVLTGKSGYDLVVPSNSNVSRQIQAGAYQELDKSLIPNFNNIDPDLLKKMSEVDPGNKYAIPYFWGINTLAINVDKVSKALGTDKLPDNEWDLVFNPEYTKKLKSCGISFFDSPTEQIPLALNYIGKDPNSQNVDDIKAAVDMMKKVRADIKTFSSSSYIDNMANGNLCVAIGYGGDLNIAKNRALEVKNGINIDVLSPKTGVGLWIDSFMIPKGAQNVVNAHKYINFTLEPKVAARNGNFVTYAPASTPARELMEKKYSNDDSIFPNKEVLEKSFMILAKPPEVVKETVKLWQGLKAAQN